MTKGRRGRRANASGFTLLELLVVLVIVGIITTMAVISVGGREERQLAKEMERLAVLLQLAKEEAVFQSREFGLGVWEYGYQFYQMEINDWRVVLDDPHLKPHDLPQDTRLALYIEGIETELEQEPRDKPQVFVLSSGEMTIFEFTMEAREDVRGPHRLSGDALGNLQLELVDGESSQ